MDHSGTEELIPLVSGDGRERMFQKSKGRALTSSQHRSDQTDDSSTTSMGIFFKPKHFVPSSHHFKEKHKSGPQVITAHVPTFSWVVRSTMVVVLM